MRPRLRVGIAFGVRDAATARAIAEIGDAVVVGSRTVLEIENSSENEVAANVGKLILELHTAINAN